MADTQIIGENFLKYNPQNVQSAVNSVFWVIVALIFLGVIAFFAWKLIRKLILYKYHVSIHRKVGEIAIKEEDKARKILDNEGNYFFHYLRLNKKSPVVHDNYLKIVKKKGLLGFPMSLLGFDVYFTDGKVIPMMTNVAFSYSPNPGHLVISHVGLTGIDYDAFNFLQSQIKSNLQKYQRIDRLMQMLPYVGLFVVVMGFILGMIFYTKHIETVVKDILGFTQQTAQKALENQGITQILTGK